MLLFIADENFNNDIVRGLLRQKPDIDIVRVQDIGLSGAEDPELLAWAADNNRVMLTHDAATMTHFAYERVQQRQMQPKCLPAPGRRNHPIFLELSFQS
jgi:predicted nuclease of predicted toxin-antitoxin system